MPALESWTEMGNIVYIFMRKKLQNIKEKGKVGSNNTMAKQKLRKLFMHSGDL